MRSFIKQSPKYVLYILTFAIVFAIAFAFISKNTETETNAAPPPEQEFTYAILAAGERTAVLNPTGLNVTTNNNGSEWYYNTDMSMGFAPGGETIDQDSADFGHQDDPLRLSWHLSGSFLNGGWRAGTTLWLNDDFEWRRDIYQSNTQPDYYPYGPQVDVPISALTGWTLCYSGYYGETVVLNDIWAACDQDYLLLAGGRLDFNKVEVKKNDVSVLEAPGGEQNSEIRLYPGDTLDLSLFEPDAETPISWSDYKIFVSNCSPQDCDTLQNPMIEPESWDSGTVTSTGSYVIPEEADNRYLGILIADDETGDPVGEHYVLLYVSHIPLEYTISTCEELQAINDGKLADNFTQTQDIDCFDTINWNDGEGFAPIGDSQFRFTGSFNGQGYKITNLYINRPDTNYIGLFGVIEDGSEVHDINLEEVDITGDGSVGALAGVLSGTVTNAYSSGHVNGEYYVGGLVGKHIEPMESFSLMQQNARVQEETLNSTEEIQPSTQAEILSTGSTIITSHSDVDVSGYEALGGLVGFNEKLITGSYATGSVTAQDSEYSDAGGLVGQNEGTITESYATGDISGDSESSGRMGGLVGRNIDDGIITESYATGSVSGYEKLGGISGANGGIITDAYAKGSVTGDFDLGGISGRSGGEIYNVYSTGSVTGEGSNVGAFVGRLDGDIINSFWNNETAGLEDACGNTDCSADAMPKTTAELKDIDTFTTDLAEEAWNFTNIWEINQDFNEGYPTFLYWSDADGDGVLTEDENSAPNSGDANGDEILDSMQSNVASFPNEIEGQYSVLEAPSECNIVSSVSQAEASLSASDSGYNYPAGLVDFTIDCGTPGFTAEIKLYTYGVDAAGLILRKYSTENQSYSSLSGVTLETVEIGGGTAIKATYSITDGTSLDQDDEENGIIVDPVGLGLNVVGTPNTGLGGLSKSFKSR